MSIRFGAFRLGRGNASHGIPLEVYRITEQTAFKVKDTVSARQHLS